MTSVPVFIINPNSRSGQTRKSLSAYEADIKRNFGTAKILLTQYSGHATQLARLALKEGEPLIVAVGGDGTANEVLNGFFESGKPVNENAQMATIMCGTGCDFRRTLGWPEEFSAQVSHIKNGATQKIDVGMVRATSNEGKFVERYFLNEVSTGLSGAVAYGVWKKKGKKNKLAYFLQALSGLRNHHPSDLKVQLDERTHILEHVSVLVFANGSYFGGGMHIAPTASFHDGVADIVAISDISILMALKNFHKLYAGTHYSLAQVDHLVGKKIQIGAPSGCDFLVETDGEPCGKLPAVFEILPACLNLVI